MDKDKLQNREGSTELRIHRSFQEELTHISHILVHKFSVIHQNLVNFGFGPPAHIQKHMHNCCDAKVESVTEVYFK